MKWYEKKFSDFFRKWKKGDLLLQNNEGYFGEVEHFEIGDKFEDSAIKFICYQPSGAEKTVRLSEIRHYHAHNGPILNISKYVKIVRMGEQSHLSVVNDEEAEQKEQNGDLRLIVTEGKTVDGAIGGEDENKIICIAFGLEFYTTEKRARMLKQDAMQILVSKLGEEEPLLSVGDRAPIDLTPTFTRWFSGIFGKLLPRSRRRAKRDVSGRKASHFPGEHYKERKRGS